MDNAETGPKGFVQKVIKFIKNPSFLIYAAVVVLFLAIAYYLYYYYILPRMNPSWVANNEFLRGKEQDTDSPSSPTPDTPDQPAPQPGLASLYLFHADWCPYSKKIFPIWNTVKENMEQKIYNKWRLQFVEIDGDKQPQDLNFFEAEYLKNAEKKKIDGYPSIYLVKGEQVTEFDAEPTVETLTEFVNSVL